MPDFDISMQVSHVLTPECLETLVRVWNHLEIVIPVWSRPFLRDITNFADNLLEGLVNIYFTWWYISCTCAIVYVLLG